MTAKQKAARAKFKKVVKEASILRKKNPKLTQAQAVKQAWAIDYSKKDKSTKKVAEVGKVKKYVPKKKAAPKKKKISEQSILNKIHRVKHDVERLDEAQHKHMIHGLKKISGVPHKSKYYIKYKYEGIEHIKYFDKLPKDRYVGSDRIVYTMALTDHGTTLIPLKHTKNDMSVKK